MVLNIENVSFYYGSGKALDSVSLSGNGGECVVIAGPNGSGKSTLLSIIAGARKQSLGKVTIKGKIGYVPQGIALFEDLSVSDNIKFFASVNGAKSVKLEALPFSINEIKNKRVNKLSGGMKKRVSIACALASDPDILILDEPCASLDILYRDELLELIVKLKKSGKLIIYVGHDFNEISAIYDKLMLIKNGQTVFYKTKTELFDASDLLEQYLRNALKNSGGKNNE